MWNDRLEYHKQILTQLKPELADKYHVSSIGLFGFVVRNDFNPSSDIDIIVDFSQPIGIEFIVLADFIENNLQKHVDLVSKNGVKQKYLRTIQSEIFLCLNDNHSFLLKI